MLDLIVGNDEPQQTVDSAAAFLFNLFIGEPQLTRAHSEEIRRTLGPFPASAANKISSTVKKILTYLPSVSSFVGPSGDSKSSSSKEAKLMKKEFGHNITFKFDIEMPNGGLTDDGDSVKSKHLALQSGYDSLSDDDSVSNSIKDSNIFTQTVLSGIQQSVTKPVTDKKEQPKPVPQSNSSPAVPYSGEWLRSKCKECAREGMVGFPWHDLFSNLFELLCSSEDSEALQSDVSHCTILCVKLTCLYLLQLIELVGVTQFDLVQELLTHRHQIVDTILQDGSSLLSSGTPLNGSLTVDVTHATTLLPVL